MVTQPILGSNNSSFLWFTSCLCLWRMVRKVVPRVTFPIYYSLPSDTCWLAHSYTQGMFIEHLSEVSGRILDSVDTAENKTKSLPSDCVQCGVRTSWCAWNFWQAGKSSSPPRCQNYTLTWVRCWEKGDSWGWQGKLGKEITCFSGMSARCSTVVLGKSNSSCFWGTACGQVVPLTPLEPSEDIHLYCALELLGNWQGVSGCSLQMQPSGCLFLNSGSTKE